MEMHGNKNIYKQCSVNIEVIGFFINAIKKNVFSRTLKIHITLLN